MPHTAHRTPHTAHRTPHTAHRTPHTAHRTPLTTLALAAGLVGLGFVANNAEAQPSWYAPPDSTGEITEQGLNRQAHRSGAPVVVVKSETSSGGEFCIAPYTSDYDGFNNEQLNKDCQAECGSLAIRPVTMEPPSPTISGQDYAVRGLSGDAKVIHADIVNRGAGGRDPLAVWRIRMDKDYGDSIYTKHLVVDQIDGVICR